jgi:hypothetical protein
MKSIKVMDYLKNPILFKTGSRFFWTNCIKTSKIPIEDLIKIYDRKKFDMMQIDKNHFRFIGSTFSNSFEEFYISNRENHFFIVVSENEYKQFSKNIMQEYSREVQLLAAAKYNL